MGEVLKAAMRLADDVNRRWKDKLGLDEHSGFQVEPVLGFQLEPIFDKDGQPLFEATVYGGASCVGSLHQVEVACRQYLLSKRRKSV